MPARTGILIGVAALVVGLAAREYLRVKIGEPAVRIVSPVSGSVSEVYVGVNADVKAGQVLAKIDSPALRSRLETAKADLEMERSAEINAAAAAADAESNSVLATGRIEMAKADVERCAQIEADAEAASRRQWVLAPVDGRVTAVKAQIGQPVGPRSHVVLFEMAPNHAM